MIILNKALEFDPEKRYQNPGAMLKDVEKAIQLIESGGEATAAALESANVDESDMNQEGEGKTIMVIENKLEFQNLLREKLKNRGYRVLVFSDPARALTRFSDPEEIVADCIVVSAINLGNDALDFFNHIGDQEHTKDLPVLLLADQRQVHIIERARVSEHRKIITMPLKVRELRETILHLLQSDPVQE